MALSRLRRKCEETEGKGNCAFNAFALAICDEFIMMQIEHTIKYLGLNIDIHFNVFIQAVSRQLGVDANWQTVTKCLLDLRKQNKVRLQQVLAPILREISINIALDSDPAIYLMHQDRLYVPFLNAFENYRENKQLDDVFCRHAFIIDKFRSVLLSSSNDVQQDKAIDQWWWKEGYIKFHEKMRNSGEWAGDVDLQRLADYFQVILTVLRDNEEMGTHGDYGYLPLLQDESLQEDLSDIYYCLYSRGVISRNQRKENNIISHAFDMAEFKKIANRLAKVPVYELVLKFIEGHFDGLKKQIVPDAWPKNCIYELIQRNIIGRGKDGKSYVFLLDAGSALTEIDEIKHYKEVIAACRKYHRERGSIVLHNTKGEHWENTTLILTADETRHRMITFAFNKNPPSVGLWSIAEKTPSLERRKSDEQVLRRLT